MENREITNNDLGELKMRATCEIVADLKDGKEVPYEELNMACLVQSSIIFFYQQDTKNLLKGGIAADLVEQMNYNDDKTSSKSWDTLHGIGTQSKKIRLNGLGQVIFLVHLSMISIIN